jgi:hypothetical protein
MSFRASQPQADESRNLRARAFLNQISPLRDAPRRFGRNDEGSFSTKQDSFQDKFNNISVYFLKRSKNVGII